MKKRILFVLYNLEIGGAEKSLITLLHTLDYQNYDVDLFLYRHRGELIHQLPEQVNLLPEIASYSTFDKSTKETIRSGYWFIGALRIISILISKLFKKKSIYTQISNGITSKFLPSLEKEYDVAISYIWTHDFIVNNVKARKKIGWIHTDYNQLQAVKWIERRLLRNLDFIVSVSPQCKQSFDESHPDLIHKSVCMENITLPSLLYKMAKEPLQEKQWDRYAAVKILTVARLHPDKGVDRAVEACKLLVNEGFHIKWYVIGYGVQESELRERINHLGIEENFILLGKKNNPYPYFNNADLYVQPSRFEGKSIAITEAKIFRLPVITTDYPSAKDQVKHGIDGLIVENSIEGIFRGVKRLIENPEETEMFKERVGVENLGNQNEIEKFYQMIGS